MNWIFSLCCTETGLEDLPPQQKIPSEGPLENVYSKDNISESPNSEKKPQLNQKEIAAFNKLRNTFNVGPEFRLVSSIGKGAYGEVVLAHHLPSDGM